MGPSPSLRLGGHGELGGSGHDPGGIGPEGSATRQPSHSTRAGRRRWDLTPWDRPTRRKVPLAGRATTHANPGGAVATRLRLSAPGRPEPQQLETAWHAVVETPTGDIAPEVAARAVKPHPVAGRGERALLAAVARNDVDVLRRIAAQSGSVQVAAQVLLGLRLLGEDPAAAAQALTSAGRCARTGAREVAPALPADPGRRSPARPGRPRHHGPGPRDHRPARGGRPHPARPGRRRPEYLDRAASDGAGPPGPGRRPRRRRPARGGRHRHRSGEQHRRPPLWPSLRAASPSAAWGVLPRRSSR